MGSCFSSSSSSSSHSDSLHNLTSKVITLTGGLREYPNAIPVSKVLRSESPASCFLCNSDQLYYNECIQCLPPTEELQLGQIYFILPMKRLNVPLTASDMVDLAVKASSAMGKCSKNGNKRQKFIRVSPDSEVTKRLNEERFDQVEKVKVAVVSRSGSVRKLQRNASRRAKLAMRSFRCRLSIIPECSHAEKECD